jgi:3'(2'), 5'-bisphosphate nucleotidase
VSLDLAALAHQIAALAERAAAAILEIYESDFAVEHKDDRSPLTAADLASHHIIVEGLGALTPDIPVLSEESAGVAWTTRQRWSRYWIVDPLDGTREFVKRNGEFTVNIALIEEHKPVLGIVQQPCGGELAAAWRGGGTWIGKPGEKARHVTTRRRASPIVVAGSRSHASDRETEILARIGHHAKLPMGSSLKFLRIASAEADLYLRLGPTSEWDTAAGQCVLEEAGGVVLDLSGMPLRYNTRDSLINPDFVAIGDPDADWSALFSGP